MRHCWEKTGGCLVNHEAFQDGVQGDVFVQSLRKNFETDDASPSPSPSPSPPPSPSAASQDAQPTAQAQPDLQGRDMRPKAAGARAARAPGRRRAYAWLRDGAASPSGGPCRLRAYRTLLYGAASASR